MRWREARNLYVGHSSAARRDVRCGGPFHFHMSLGTLLRRHFTKVEGADGYYVLTETIAGED